MGDDGWTFQGEPGSDPEPFCGFEFLREPHDRTLGFG
ncbi:hypothetical protein MYXA107069_08470 [Myxococcus xanthus]|nr:hypothetical protein MyxoNM_35955 [Myxococcus xanthus]SDW12209.1 putative glutathione S-transferase [Myxococcus xanthus]